MANAEGIEVYGVKIRNEKRVFLSAFARQFFGKKLGMSPMEIHNTVDEDLVKLAEHKAYIEAKNTITPLLKILRGKTIQMKLKSGEIIDAVFTKDGNTEIRNRLLSQLKYGNLQPDEYTNIVSLLENAEHVGYRDYDKSPEEKANKPGFIQNTIGFNYFKIYTKTGNPLYVSVANTNTGRNVIYCISLHKQPRE